METIDVKENKLLKLSANALNILLQDRTTGKNIIWATNNYSKLGFGYEENSQITINAITGKNGNVIKPRIEKSKNEQIDRIKNRAEVFTPSWICNKQNNMIDNHWLGKKDLFNYEIENGWETNAKKIEFSDSCGKTWMDYINNIRLEITCGEAPYLTSRYDTVTGKFIDVKDRIGLLDRKLRVINENSSNDDWFDNVLYAYKSIYAYEFQGDNLLLARENLLYTFIDNYILKFDENPKVDLIEKVAEIISWNIWQMDGLKYVVPNSCHRESLYGENLFGEQIIDEECIGCKNNAITKHNGIYSKIMDWEKGKTIKFINVFLKGK